MVSEINAQYVVALGSVLLNDGGGGFVSLQLVAAAALLTEQRKGLLSNHITF